MSQASAWSLRGGVDLTRAVWTRDRFEELVPMTPRVFSVCLAARLAVTG